MSEAPLLCIAEAARKGIDRLRLPIWSTPMDHLKIDIVNGEPGPWGHLFSPINIGINGRDPVDFLWVIQGEFDIYQRAYEAYAGPMPDSDEYKAASTSAASFFARQST